MRERLIERILIPKSETMADDPSAACSWVGYFFEEAIARGYDGDELPPDVMRFADLWEYHGGVNNGGHAQYYENEEESRPRLKFLAGFLEEIGLPEHANLVKDLERIAIENEDRIADLYEREDNDTVKEMFYDFDDRLVQLERSEGKLLEQLAKWLLRQPWIEIEDAEKPADVARLRQLIPDPPFREARLAARMRRREAETRSFLMAFARRYEAYRSRRR
jgi:hypothetical protein